MMTYFLLRNDKIKLDIETEENKESVVDNNEPSSTTEQTKVNGQVVEDHSTEKDTNCPPKPDQMSAVCIVSIDSSWMNCISATIADDWWLICRIDL